MHNSITAWVEVGQYNSFDVINTVELCYFELG